MNTVSHASPEVSSQEARARDFFTGWAAIYDSQPNPLLSLEERYLAELLPSVAGLAVVDVGCGTGRWLTRLVSRGATSLTGIDSSSAMVGRARERLGASATIFTGEADSLPLPAASSDLLLASFVASYVRDLDGFAKELRRVARADARIFLSDLHPETARDCNWKRGYKIAGASVEPAIFSRSIPQVIASFEAQGLEAVLLLEPPFGEVERDIFRRAGKMSAFDEAAGRPAIYLLQLTRRKTSRISIIPEPSATPALALKAGPVAFGPGECTYADIAMANGVITSVGCFEDTAKHAQQLHTLDLDGYLLLPGLINSHDHLEFGLFPNLGHGPYENSEQWAQDIHQADAEVIERHRKIPREVRLWWGAIRNLLCGATTVCHHNPIDPVLLGDEFPIRIISRFGWAHSLVMDPGLVSSFRETASDVPFVVHAAEGIDERSANEIFELDRLGVLDDRTVLIHGLALNPEGFRLLNERRAALVWCPTSNRFLFDQTHDWKALLGAERVMLGSDSPLTCAGDLSDEIHYAYQQAGVPAEELYRLVTTKPAEVFRFDVVRGIIRPGAAADVIAVRRGETDPAFTLARISADDIDLVVVAGRVQLASEELLAQLPTELSDGLDPLEVDGRIRWIRAPLHWLFRETTRILGHNLTLGNKKVRHVCATGN